MKWYHMKIHHRHSHTKKLCRLENSVNAIQILLLFIPFAMRVCVNIGTILLNLLSLPSHVVEYFLCVFVNRGIVSIERDGCRCRHCHCCSIIYTFLMFCCRLYCRCVRVHIWIHSSRCLKFIYFMNLSRFHCCTTRALTMIEAFDWVG